MKSYFRFLSRNILYTLIEITGMAVAIAFVLFIGTFLIGEFTADSAIRKQGNIYVGASENIFLTSATIKEQVEGKFPEIESVCRTQWTYTLRGLSMEMTAGEMDEPLAQDAIITDKDFFTLLPLPLTEGRADQVLEQKNAVVLSESFAATAFPDRNPLGETVTVSINGEEMFLTVTGIFKDFKNSILHSPQIIYRTDIIEILYPNLLRNGNGTTTLFYRIAEGTDMASLNKRIEAEVKAHDILYQVGLMNEYRLVPFSEIGNSEIEMTVPFENIVPMGFIRLFLAAGILLLLFAVFNYISLTVAQTGFRAKEMASRRLVGAQRSAIIARYILESFILTCFAFLLALVITGLTSPAFSSLVRKNIDPLANIGIAEMAFMAALILLLSFCSGIIPAIAVSKYKPIDIVKGNLSGRTKMTLGKILITCQSIIAIATLSVSGIMFLQLKHMISRPMGYETDGRIRIAGAQHASDYRIDELRTIPGVEEAGWLQNDPMTNSSTGATLTMGGREIRLDLFYCDSSAFRILGFETVKVCQGHKDGGLWIPESALAGMGLDYDSMEIPFDNAVIPLCGIIRDFRKGSANSENSNGYIITPMIIDMNSDDDFAVLRQLVVRTSSDEQETAKRLEDFYREHGENNVITSTYNMQKRIMYQPEERNLKLTGVFTLLTLLLTSLAMLAMSTYFAKQNARGTALKKVMGCSRKTIFMDTAYGFLKPVAIAAVLSIPLAWILAGRWLEGYSYRIENDIWVYLAAALCMAAAAVISISWQTVRLMNTDPASVLKSE